MHGKCKICAFHEKISENVFRKKLRQIRKKVFRNKFPEFRKNVFRNKFTVNLDLRNIAAQKYF